MKTKLTSKKLSLIHWLAIICSLALLSACNSSDNSQDNAAQLFGKPFNPDRWYSKEQFERGQLVFQTNCATCHKADASGTKDWKTPDASGHYPPPPLNGDAHAWHHSLDVLRRVVRNGGIALGGTMPGFAEQLNADEIDSALAWIQNQWSDEIYAIWLKRNQ